jgi:lipopolysaccharide transport system permease protein
LLLPLLLVITTIFSSGVGLLFGALTVVFRDMRHLTNFILMIWMYVTPVFFPLSLVPENYQVLLYLNPLTSLVEAFRWVFLHEGYLLVSFVVALLIWFSGAIAFRAMENKVADVM